MVQKHAGYWQNKDEGESLVGDGSLDGDENIELLVQSTSSESHAPDTPRSWQLVSRKLAGDTFATVSFTNLLLVGLLGPVSLLKLGYLVFFFLLSSNRYTSHTTARRLWRSTVAYSGIAFFAMYLFQFDPIHASITDKLGDHVTNSTVILADIGLVNHSDSPSSLFSYLVCTDYFILMMYLVEALSVLNPLKARFHIRSLSGQVP